ncbi:hypothetical protein A5675_11025 [Mycobacterium malmoense]|uniref:hypothetical protein n=1 Tax=Mycobacterium malmoense TaxID=1780 RepID=UPI00080B1645|nr:hypothetical protein [Mycobacterium malmoense]OCB41045.1 hypothetical protein A5675_11025 [Mycobacterium malmoense]
MTDISVQTTTFGPYERPHPWGERPDDLPISAAAWDKARLPQSFSETALIKALFEAVKQLEANQKSDSAPSGSDNTFKPA